VPAKCPRCSVPPVAILVRSLEPTDVDGVVALAVRAWHPVHASMAVVLGEALNSRIYPDWAATQATDVAAACDDPRLHVSVALNDQRIAGFVVVRIDDSQRSGEVDMIAVDPSSQGRGVGHALTQYALSQMREAGCAVAVVATGGDEGHAPARALYESEGFTALPLVRYYREL
jgi:ribosomal protein S18 acetylase RimI-like enzyme